MPHRFKNRVEDLTDDKYDIYMAKKNNGKPKDDYPNFEVKMTVKEANVKENRFSVIFSSDAIEVPQLERVAESVIEQLAPVAVTVELNNQENSDVYASTTLVKSIQSDQGKQARGEQIAAEQNKGCCTLF